MTHFSRRSIVAGVALSPALLRARTILAPDVRSTFEQLLKDSGSPGAAFAAVKKGRIVAQFGLGKADIATGRAVSADTPFHAASVSKVVAATSILQLVDRRILTLDQPLGPLLDFPLVHPAAPDRPITLLNLLQHTSGISDRNYGAKFYGKGDSAIGLRDFLIGYLTPGGRWYTREGSFSNTPPGERWSYSNVGIALAAYVAERAGYAIDRHGRERLFAPLGMTNSAWHLRDIDVNLVATPYLKGSAGVETLPHIGYPDWPGGMLRSSAADLARFLTIFTGSGSRILRRSTIERMTTVSVFPGFSNSLDGQAIAWRRIKSAERALLSHTGTDPGTTTGVYLDPATRTAAVVLFNLSPDAAARAARTSAVDRLLAIARTA